MMEQSSPAPTMEDLLAQLTSGGHLSWKAVSSPADIPERFFQVHQSWDYKPGRFTWENQDDVYCESRYRLRTNLSEIAPPRITFSGPSGDVVDFYGTSREFSFMSERLFGLLTDTDPQSVESLPVELTTRDGTLPFHAAVPTRSISAIDVSRTDIELRDQNIMAKVLPVFDFPNGIVFNNAQIGDATNFRDLDIGGWYWSSELLRQAEQAGVRGLYAVSKSGPRDRKCIRL